MPDRRLTERIRAEVLNAGMDLIGFAPVSRWEQAPYLLSPQAILPESKTVIVAAIHITDTWTEMGGEPSPQENSPGGWMDQNSFMDRIAYRTVRLLNDAGHTAIAVASSNIWRYRAFEGIPSLFAPDLSHIHAAVAAGLAEIGWSGLAITPEFGPRCRFISIVTDAELKPTPMYDGPKLCDMCMECVKHCPTAALRKELGKPHEVVIGGKTYRYANKNIWRCAWAEHFNQDLDSENLKKLDHISEKEILQELKEHGTRGHERGVCQKFCVPPHLRSDKPSFGRADRQITQNRINRRYPDNMPTLRKMRDDIIAYAESLGAEIAEVGPITPDSTAFERVNTEAPGMKTAIGFAILIPAEAQSASTFDPDVASAYGGALWMELHHIALRVARKVEDYGYHAASYTGGLGWTGLPFELAEMAGVGRINTEGKFETPEFGTNVLAAAVVTDAPLDSTAPVDRCENTITVRPLSAAALRTKLARVAEDNLVSLFGVAPVERFAEIVNDLKANIDESVLPEEVVDGATWPHGAFEPTLINTHARIRGPQDYLPTAKSVIVLSMHFPAAVIENAGLDGSKQIGTYGFHQYQTTYELRFAAINVVRALQEQGYQTIITENMLGIGSHVDSPRGLLPDARCNAIEAVAAGLGEIGRHGSLLTPAHGAHQRQIVIITDAELPTDTLYHGEAVCRNCGACQQQCPMQALESHYFDLHIDDAVIAYPLIPRLRCDWSKRYALCSAEGPALIGNITNVEPPAGDVTIQDIANACAQKDPVMKSRTCILETCLRRCPAGPMASKIADQTYFQPQQHAQA